jgi:hypothetical protein
MTTMRRILKADEVALEEPLQLCLEPAAPVGGPKAPTAADPSVRIAQNHAEYAVLEVTCPCGRTTYVRCDYAASHASSTSPDALP